MGDIAQDFGARTQVNLAGVDVTVDTAIDHHLVTRDFTVVVVPGVMIWVENAAVMMS